MRRLTAGFVVAVALAVPSVEPVGAAAPAGHIEVVDRPPVELRIADDERGGLLLRYPDAIVRRRADGTVEQVATGIRPIAIAADPRTGEVYFSELERIARVRSDGRIVTVAGHGVSSLEIGPDGSIWYVDFDRIRRLRPDGTVTTEVEKDDAPFAYFVSDLAVSRTGAVAILDGGYRVWLWENGTLRRIAGRLGPGPDVFCQPASPCGDGGPATQAALGTANIADFAADGTLYVRDASHRVRAIGTDGVIRHVAGSYRSCAEAGPACRQVGAASLAELDELFGLAVVGNDLYVHDKCTGCPYWLFGDRPPTRLLRVADVSRVPPARQQGYRFLAADGGTFRFGWTGPVGSLAEYRLNSPILGGATAGPDQAWFLGADGGVFTFLPDAFHGSAAGRTRSPAAAMAAATDGRGYWVLERNGAVHAFGSAPHAGSAPAALIPYAGIAAPEGGGYWVARADGAVFAFGGASTTGCGPASVIRGLERPIVGIVASPDGRGCWLVADDGGVFAFGTARFHGSTGDIRLNRPIIGMAPTPSGQGYWLVASDGGVFSFGDADFHGSTGNIRLNRPVVAVLGA